MGILEKKHAMRILYILDRYDDKMYLTQIMEELGRRGSLVENRLNELKFVGLICEKSIGKKRYFWLTEKGKEVATHIVKLQAILGEGWEGVIPIFVQFLKFHPYINPSTRS